MQSRRLNATESAEKTKLEIAMLPATGTASFDEKKRGPKTMRNCVYARSDPTPRSRFIERHTTGGVTFNMEMRKRERLNDTYLKGTLGKDQPTSRLQNRLRFIVFSANNECRTRTSFFRAWQPRSQSTKGRSRPVSFDPLRACL